MLDFVHVLHERKSTIFCARTVDWLKEENG